MKRMKIGMIVLNAVLAIAAMSACGKDKITEPSSSITRRADFVQCSWSDGPNGERENYECHIELSGGTGGGTSCTFSGCVVNCFEDPDLCNVGGGGIGNGGTGGCPTIGCVGGGGGGGGTGGGGGGGDPFAYDTLSAVCNAGTNANIPGDVDATFDDDGSGLVTLPLGAAEAVSAFACLQPPVGMVGAALEARLKLRSWLLSQFNTKKCQGVPDAAWCLELFRRYLDENGSPFNLTQVQFQSIVGSIDWSSPGTGMIGSFPKNGTTYTVWNVNFYQGSFGYMLGTATIHRDPSGAVVGFIDTWNLDVHIGATNRDWRTQWNVGGAAILSVPIGQHPYDIKYGVQR